MGATPNQSQPDATPAPEPTEERIAYELVNEVAYCLSECMERKQAARFLLQKTLGSVLKWRESLIRVALALGVSESDASDTGRASDTILSVAERREREAVERAKLEQWQKDYDAICGKGLSGQVSLSVASIRLGGTRPAESPKPAETEGREGA